MIIEETQKEYNTAMSTIGNLLDNPKSKPATVYTENVKESQETKGGAHAGGGEHAGGAHGVSKSSATYDGAQKEAEELRKETMERNDTSFSRLIKDILNSGINPNLVNISASPNYQNEQMQFDKVTEMLNEAFTSKENQQDRLTKLLVAFIAALGLVMKGGITAAGKEG